jgi:hypothetical protein
VANCATRLAEAERASVTSVCVRHPGSYTLPEALIATFGAGLVGSVGAG